MKHVLCIAMIFCWAVTVQAAPPGKAYDYATDVRPILESRCFKCHGPDTQKGKIRFDTLSTNFVNDPDAVETWQDASGQIKLGDMPPDKAEPLDARQREVLTGWIDQNLQRAIDAATPRGVVIRRLNRNEYQHTMTDLLGFEMDYTGDLPADPVSPDGFQNNGSVLGMSALAIECYLASSLKAMNLVLVEGAQPELGVIEVPINRRAGETPRWPKKPHYRLGRTTFWEGKFGGNEIPRSGRFTIRVKARAVDWKKGSPAPILWVRFGYYNKGTQIQFYKVVGEIEVTSTKSAVYELSGRSELHHMPAPNVDPESVDAMIEIKNGLLDVTTLPKQVEVVLESVDKNGKRKQQKAKDYPEVPNYPKIHIEAVEFVRNDFASWPTPAHRRIVPDGEDLASAESVTRVLNKFLRRAWRRPVTNTELTQWTNHYQAVRKQSDTDIEALRETLAASLASANFLYLSEPTPRSKDATRSLTTHQLASRLSYFLWSSMPDAELSAAADSGALMKPAELRKQFERMVNDPKSNRFIESFSNQWLNLDAVNLVAINPQVHRFDDALKADMVAETRAFFAEILRTNTSALQFLDADFTMLNGPLAKHYGFTGPKSPKSQFFERVAIADLKRRPGGLLGHASTHMAGSDGADTHPILRAVWIRERLLDDPPAPPPPDVPDISKSVPNFEKLSVRDQLAAHSQKESCADCHRGLDPWGIALEHYSPLGQWRERTKRTKKTVSAETVLPGDHAIDGVAELQKFLLSNRKDQFARALVTKLATYALGRSLVLKDEPMLNDLNDRFRKNDHRLIPLMQSIVTSQEFLSR